MRCRPTTTRSPNRLSPSSPPATSPHPREKGSLVPAPGRQARTIRMTKRKVCQSRFHSAGASVAGEDFAALAKQESGRHRHGGQRPRRSWRIPPRTTGPAVRAGRLRPQTRRHQRAGPQPVRLPHHSGAIALSEEPGLCQSGHRRTTQASRRTQRRRSPDEPDTLHHRRRLLRPRARAHRRRPCPARSRACTMTYAG